MTETISKTDVEFLKKIEIKILEQMRDYSVLKNEKHEYESFEEFKFHFFGMMLYLLGKFASNALLVCEKDNPVLNKKIRDAVREAVEAGMRLYKEEE